MKKTAFIILLAFTGNISVAQTPLVTAPHFEAKDFNGNPHHLYDYLDAGNFVLLSFFTTSCGTCSIFNPHVNQAYLNYGCNTGNLIVLGINWGSTNQGLAQYHALNNLSFPALSGFDGYGNVITNLYQIASFITVILIGPNRQIVEQYIYPPSITVLDSVLAFYNINQMPCTVGNNDFSFATDHTISVFPNPAKTQLTVHIPYHEPGELQLSIYNCSGQLLLTRRLKSCSESTYQHFDISGFNPGLYFIVPNALGTALKPILFSIVE